MSKSIKIIWISIFLLISIFFEALLIYLFDPDTGDMGLWATEIAYMIFILLLLIGFSFLFFKLITKKNIFVFVLAFLVILILQILTYSSEFGRPPFKQIISFVRTYKSFPENVDYEDLYSHISSKKAAALVKYRNNLPTQIVKLNFDSYGDYIIIIKGKDSIFDRSALKINYHSDSVFFNLSKSHKIISLRRSIIIL